LQDVGDGAGQIHGELNLVARHQQAAEQHRHQQHAKGIELGQPGHDDGGVAIAGREAPLQTMGHARHLSHARQARQSARNDHHQDDVAHDGHARVPGRFRVLADGPDAETELVHNAILGTGRMENAPKKHEPRTVPRPDLPFRPGNPLPGTVRSPRAEITQITQDFKTQTGQDLNKVLAGKLDNTELRRAQLLMQGDDKFLPRRDAEMLDIAMTGAGTDERLVLDTLYGKSDKERAKIASAYQQRTGHSLEQDIKSEHSGRTETFALATLKRGKIDDADRLHAAMAGLGTDTEAVFKPYTDTKNSIISIFKKSNEKRLEGDI